MSNLNLISKPTIVEEEKIIRTKTVQYWDTKSHKFACSGKSQNLNSHITDELEKLKEIYENTNDKGRSIAYRKAVTFIKGLSKRIESEEDVKKLPHIGEKI